jgi:fibronectin type 3 domain-containing protein
MKMSYFGENRSGRALGLVNVLVMLLMLAAPLGAQETIGGGTIANPAVGPAPSYGIGGSGAVLVKNWNFGTGGTIKTMSDMNNHFLYRDQFNTINNGGNYGASIVAPDAAHALPGQPIEGVNCPPVRAFSTNSLLTYLEPLNGATTVSPSAHNVGCGSFMANWTLPAGGSLLGMDIVWETRVRYVPPPYFWFAIWTAGNIWLRGAEHDIVESFGYDNGGGFTNFDGRYWHSGTVTGSDTVSYSSWSAGMASVGITNYDASQYHTWTWLYKADNTYAIYVDGIQVQSGSGPYPWTVSVIPGGRPINMSFLFDAGWGHTGVSGVNFSMPASNLAGTFYEWDYSRVYLVPPTTVPPAPTNLRTVADNTSTMLLWNLTPGASSFNVYRSTSPGGQGATPIATGITALAYTDTGLSNGTTYYYKVAGVNSVGVSAQSNEASTTPLVTYIVDDADPACTYTGTWTVATSNIGYYGTGYRFAGTSTVASATFTPTLPATGSYEVFMRYPADGNRANNTPLDINHAGGTATVTVNQRLNYNTWISLGTYTFNAGTSGSVRIRNDGLTRSVLADAVKWVPVPTGTSGPAAPSLLTATAVSSNQVNLTWADNATNETGFTIERKTGAGAFASLTTKGANSTSHNDTTVTAGTSHTYRVRADNTNGSSAWSNEANTTTPIGSLLSAGQAATASSVQPGNEVAHGNDGNLNTRWSASTAGYPQWWKVDLGTLCDLRTVVIDWYNPSNLTRYYRYRLEVSADDSTYTTVVDKTNNTKKGTTTDLLSATGRYLRVTVTGADVGWASFHECRVYGNDAALRLWHRFDEGSGTTAADSSFNNNHGTLQNGPTWTTGQLAGGLSFDGSNDVVTVPPSGTLNNLPAMTLSAWMRPNSSGENAFGRILQKENGFRLFLTSSNQLSFQVSYGTTSLTRTTGSNVVSYSGWTHVAVTWDGSTSAGNVRIYVNGAQVGGYSTTTNGAGMRGDDSGGNLHIGNNAALDRTFNGVLDDVRIYSRVLSPAEVAALP